MRFDLTDIRLFLTVTEHGSLTKGAQALNLALASVSERISNMEQSLGTTLLERSSRGISPTAAGNALIRHGRIVLGQVEQMRGELRGYAQGLRGRIRLLSNTAALAGFLPPHLLRFLTMHPDLSIDLNERPSHDIALALIAGRADLGIAADIADLRALQTRVVAQDALMVVMSKAHPFAERAVLRFADIIDENFVGHADAALEIHLGEHAARLGRQINYRVQFKNLGDVGRMVEAGIGLAILSEASARALDHAELAIVPLGDPWAIRQLHLCAVDFEALSPHATLLAELLLTSKATARH